MIRVLQCVNNMHRAGLETMLMNYYRNIDRTQIQFDFLTHRPERSDYDDEIECLGGRIYYTPRLYPQNYPAYFQYMKRFFAEHPEYKIVHSHIDSMSFLPLLAAKRAGVPVRIAHSHSASIDPDLKYPLKQCFRMGLPAVANHFLACGDKAGRFLYRGRAFRVIPNAIDPTAFIFDPEMRKAKREELMLNDRLVLGHVGRFSYPKNHEFLVDVFVQVLKKNPNAVLMLVGTGETEPEIRARVQRLGITESVLFMGSRSDVSSLYQVMDLFVMPSHYEGVPVVGIEAQFSGLPCIFSDRVSREVMFTDRCYFFELEKSAVQWAEFVLKYTNTNRIMAQSGYLPFDIRNTQKDLTDYYLSLNARIENKLELH